MRTSRIHKNPSLRYEVGDIGPVVDYLPADKVPAFLKLVDAVKARTGGIDSAARYIGIANATLAKARDGKISKSIGKKILAAYNKIKSENVLK